MQPSDPQKSSLWALMRQPWAPWAKRLALYLGGQWITLLGSALVQYAMIWYVMRTTDSAMMMTLGTVCGMVPQALIAPVAGVWADRYDRKKLIIVADASIAATTLLLAALFFMGYGSIWLLFVLSAIRGLGSGIQSPAVSAVLPQIVPEEHLMRVNGINGSAQSFTTVIPPIISGWMLSQMSLESIFFVDVVTAAIGIALLLLVQLPRHVGQDKQERSHPWHEMREGLAYTWGARPIFVLTCFHALMMFLIVPAALLSPLMVQRTFGNEIWRLTAIEVVFGAGSLLGGAVIAAWGGFKNRTKTMVFSTITLGLLSIVMGVPMRFSIFLAVMAFVGFWVPVYSTPSITLLQENVDPQYMGRVFSVIQTLSTLCFPLGMLVFGPLSDSMPIEWLFVATGILTAGLGIAMGRNRVLRQAGEPHEIQAPASEENTQTRG